MSSMVGVVTRQVPGCDTVVSAVITLNDRDGIDIYESYFNSAYKRHVEIMKEKIPELQKAEWKLTLINAEEW